MQKKKMLFVIPPDQLDIIRNPGHPEGDNRSRSNSFTWHLNSKKGKIFQSVLKPAIIVVINKMHSWVLKSWDPEGFKYDDPRLQYLDETLHGFIDEYYDHEERKLDFMHQAVDIGLFILKEDIYYRGRIFHMLNLLPIFEIPSDEVVNMKHDWKSGNLDLETKIRLENDPANASMPERVIV